MATNQQESSSEDFEELAESRELVEEKLFKTKFAVINLTLTQTQQSVQIETLEQDV